MRRYFGVLCLIWVSGLAYADACKQRGEPLLLRMSLQPQTVAYIAADVEPVVFGPFKARLEDGQVCVPQEEVSPIWSEWSINKTNLSLYLQPLSDLRLTIKDGQLQQVGFSLSLFAAGVLAADEALAACQLQSLDFSSASVNGQGLILRSASNDVKGCIGADQLQASGWGSGDQAEWLLLVEFLRPPAEGGLKEGIKRLFEKQDIDDSAKKRLRKF